MMAKGRIVSCSLSSSRKFHALYATAGPLAEFSQSLYPLLVIHSDDFGRMHGDAFTIKAKCHPMSPRSQDEFDQALNALRDVGMIQREEIDGQIVLQVNDFDHHQSGLHKRTKSIFPELSGKFREIPSELNRTELELKGTEQKGAQAQTVTLPQPAQIEVLPTQPQRSAPRQWSPRPKPLLANACHPSCSPSTWAACGRGMCVPPFLVSQWRQQLGNDAEDHIKAFVIQTLDPYPEGTPFGDEPLKFWRGKWRERYGTQLQGDTKGSRTVAAANRVLAKMEAVK